MSDVPSSPGLRLKSRRALLGLTQEEVAAQAHLSRSRLSQLENDEGFEGLTVGNLVNLCGVLMCSADFIIGGEP